MLPKLLDEGYSFDESSASRQVWGAPDPTGLEPACHHWSSPAPCPLTCQRASSAPISYAAMSVAKLLKFDLCPQLAGLPDCKIWLPRGMEVRDGLEKVAFANVNVKAIRDGWDDMLRLVASIMTGKVTVSWALARNGSAAAGDRLYRALDHYGRLLRSVFLCDYFTNDAFRREIHTLLKRGESVLKLQEVIKRLRANGQPSRTTWCASSVQYSSATSTSAAP
ncbi:Tn3 family transposase [Piscinibacter gummiphilus]|uniref:Tn3 family transposase n=1 Tax=Piscinibacter gummiphilus TaxID=946333 RepID=A0ABZ0D2E0_9BURK|nr:Tn3 family transposase [Piscinibacter gummiphilus]WOB11300.1 Tn3 family transposase [Piscinibacter gummiphilus]